MNKYYHWHQLFNFNRFVHASILSSFPGLLAVKLDDCMETCCLLRARCTLYYVLDMTPFIPLSADLLGSLIERIVWIEPRRSLIEHSFRPDNFHVDPN